MAQHLMQQLGAEDAVKGVLKVDVDDAEVVMCVQLMAKISLVGPPSTKIAGCVCLR
jgi:hypothetical protein